MRHVRIKCLHAHAEPCGQINECYKCGFRKVGNPAWGFRVCPQCKQHDMPGKLTNLMKIQVPAIVDAEQRRPVDEAQQQAMLGEMMEQPREVSD